MQAKRLIVSLHGIRIALADDETGAIYDIDGRIVPVGREFYNEFIAAEFDSFGGEMIIALPKVVYERGSVARCLYLEEERNSIWFLQLVERVLRTLSV